MKLTSLIPVLLSAVLSWTAFAETIVNDVTQFNPILVDKIDRPKTVEEIQDLVKKYPGAISIGGGHFSMAGQTASEKTLHIDMRDFDRVLLFQPETKSITVQSGITWRKIQDVIDPKNLSLKIMQTYANFTVGGSISVNAHGRYLGQGPLIRSLKSLRIVLADGSVQTASPSENPQLFFAAIGGYGGLGIIVEATFDLAENTKVARSMSLMPFDEYRSYFAKSVAGSSDIIFHNADLYPPSYSKVMVTNWTKSDEALTIPDRLQNHDVTTNEDRLKLMIVSEMPFGKKIRSEVFDPMNAKQKLVVWRNFEASYNVAELEPSSRKKSTYVLQEYFVPVTKLESFVVKMRKTFREHDPNILNVSIRHALPDSGSLLAWAPEEVFSLVLYYKQNTSKAADLKVKTWTKELIAAAISEGGRYYLPYQIHASSEQFHAAYPRAKELFALKKQYDPSNKFRNKLWDAYYRPAEFIE